MKSRSALYAQSGGVTAVLNASALGVIERAKETPGIEKVYAAQDGIIGVLKENLIDTSLESIEALQALYYTPGGAFGSCRYKLKSLEENKNEYERLIQVFKAHDIGYFFYNGGGDSQDTAYKIAQMSEKMHYPITCIGIPKTIDNDLPFTDTSCGFGSVAKYIAVSILEAGLDVASMSSSSTKVFILEVMGRHAGWIAASSGLAKKSLSDPPHLILFPEIPFDEQQTLKRVRECVEQFGYCVLVVSEGIKDKNGAFLTENNSFDAFGHAQLGGVAPRIAELIKTHLGYKYHWAISDYLQRAARHIASKTDVEQAYALGKAAVTFALEGKNAIMPIIVRDSDEPYQWHIEAVPLLKVANQERKMPRDYITEEGFGITNACRTYLKPLIQGEAYPPYQEGLPEYVRLKNILVKKKLPEFETNIR